MSASGVPKKPFGNCYWVQPGRLLAGEYPAGKSTRETTARLQRLLDAGIDTFVDLTQQDELSDYVNLLPTAARARIQHLRFAIPDHDVPPSPALMVSILDAIDAALEQDRRVYVHCRAGIGRTGTVIGCHLVRQGHSGDAVLDALNDLWRHCERASKWPSIPETDAQMQYVRAWREGSVRKPGAAAATTSLAERYEGALLGLAIGDAVGAGGRGIWGGDTAMTWCLAESLLQRGESDAEDQMQRYGRWLRQGEYSATGQAAGVPKEVQRAVAAWQWSRKPLAGSHDPANLDAHPLARTTAAALRHASNPTMALQVAAETARPTLQSPIVLDACRAFAAAMTAALQGAKKTELLAFGPGAAFQVLRSHALKPPVLGFIDGAWRTSGKKTAADILTLWGACWRAFGDTDSYRSGLTLAVQGSSAPATAGAVYGALAGAYYGVQGLPQEWRSTLAQAAALSKVAADLLKQASAPALRRS